MLNRLSLGVAGAVLPVLIAGAACGSNAATVTSSGSSEPSVSAAANETVVATTEGAPLEQPGLAPFTRDLATAGLITAPGPDWSFIGYESEGFEPTCELAFGAANVDGIASYFTGGEVGKASAAGHFVYDANGEKFPESVEQLNEALLSCEMPDVVVETVLAEEDFVAQRWLIPGEGVLLVGLAPYGQWLTMMVLYSQPDASLEFDAGAEAFLRETTALAFQRFDAVRKDPPARIPVPGDPPVD